MTIKKISIKLVDFVISSIVTIALLSVFFGWVGTLIAFGIHFIPFDFTNFLHTWSICVRLGLCVVLGIYSLMVVLPTDSPLYSGFFFSTDD